MSVKNNRYHYLRMVIFAGLACLAANLVFYFFLAEFSLTIDFTSQYALTLGGFTLLVLFTIVLFDAEILIYEQFRQSQDTAKKL